MRTMTPGTGRMASPYGQGQSGGGDMGQGGGGDMGQGGGGDMGQGGGGDMGQGGGGDMGQGGGGDMGQGGGGDMGQGGGGDMGQGGGGDMGQGGGGDMGQGGGGQWKSTYSLSPYVPSTIPVTIVGPVVIAQKRINFRIQLQEESEWCWAAVAASIEKYFNPRSAVEQCNVVNRVLQTSSNDFDDGCSGGCDDCKCCCHPDSDICNTPAQLADALQEIYKWRATLPRPLRFDEVQREIDGGRPIGVGITWASGNSTPNGTSSNPQPKGHFVVVRGYRVLSSGARQVYVADPLNASGLVDFDEFTLAYYGDGAWTETDLVQRGWA